MTRHRAGIQHDLYSGCADRNARVSTALINKLNLNAAAVVGRIRKAAAPTLAAPSQV